MVTGHFAGSLIAKGFVPRAPLGLLLIAAQLVDVAWSLFILLGIERLHFDPTLASNPLVLDWQPWTHSLPASLAWSLSAVVAARAAGFAPRVANALGAVVMSHWFGDLLVHRSDLPLLFTGPKLGFALWDRPQVAYALEVGLVVGGALFCVTRAQFVGRARRAVLGFATVLIAMQTASFLGATPNSTTPMALAAFTLFATVALMGAWVERRFLLRPD
jgi:hypothetical protein